MAPRPKVPFAIHPAVKLRDEVEASRVTDAAITP
jgi:hypothetical protein